MKLYGLLLFAACLFSSETSGQLVVSAEEGKINLLGSSNIIETNPTPDGLTILDFATFPPDVTHVSDVPNSVLGPPSNIAITPDRKRVLVASSVVIDPSRLEGYKPDNRVQLVDIETSPATVIDVLQVGQQPSGMCVSTDGKLALVANCASNTVSVIRVNDRELEHIGEVVVCEPGESPSDVDITPNGRLGLVAINKGQYLRVLSIDGFEVTSTQRKLSVFGKPYRCDISDDGSIAATNGEGNGNGLDANAISIIDLSGDEPRTIQYVAIGTGPETCALSPDGNMIAIALINGSGNPPDDPLYRPHGLVALLTRSSDERFELTQEVEVGRIPEGITFTSDNKYLVVQCHPDRKLWIFQVQNDQLVDTDVRIDTISYPSGIDAR